jgi:hypothetical protein
LGTWLGDETPKRTLDRTVEARRSPGEGLQLGNAGGDTSKSWPLGAPIALVRRSLAGQLNYRVRAVPAPFAFVRGAATSHNRFF